MIDLARYRSLTPDSYGFMNYTLEEVFHNIRIIETDPEKLWEVLKVTYGPTFFHPQIQLEYSQMFSQKDQERLNSEIGKIKAEAERNLANVTEKCTQEIKQMRRLIDDKEFEITQVKLAHKEELEFYKAIYKDSGYREAEQMYKERETR